MFTLKKLLLSLCLIFVSSAVFSQVCNGGNPVILHTQADVDAFPSTYGTCDYVQGRLQIGGYSTATNITNLDSLVQITNVDWLFVIDNHQLTSLDGIHNIVSSGSGKLAIQQNEVLTDISALSGFGPQVGDMSIVSNPELTSLTGLDNITLCGTALTIRTNVKLTDISALSNFTRSDRIFEISNCDLLSDISPLSNFTEFAQGVPPNAVSKAIFYLYDNDLLEDCSSLCPVLIEDLDRLRDINSLIEDVSANLNECTSIQSIKNHGVCCPDTLTVDYSMIDNGFYQAVQYLNSDKPMPLVGDIEFKAGQEIELLPNFEVSSNTTFHAYITGCN